MAHNLGASDDPKWVNARVNGLMVDAIVMLGVSLIDPDTVNSPTRRWL